MAAPAFFIDLRVYTFIDDRTFGPRLDLRIEHSDHVETQTLPVAADEAFPTEQEALARGKALAAAFMQSSHPGQGYNLEE